MPRRWRACAKRILKLYAALWTFAVVGRSRGRPNNFAERNLRAAVLWRKGSFGTHSEGAAVSSSG